MGVLTSKGHRVESLSVNSTSNKRELHALDGSLDAIGAFHPPMACRQGAANLIGRGISARRGKQGGAEEKCSTHSCLQKTSLHSKVAEIDTSMFDRIKPSNVPCSGWSPAGSSWFPGWGGGMPVKLWLQKDVGLSLWLMRADNPDSTRLGSCLYCQD